MKRKKLLAAGVSACVVFGSLGVLPIGAQGIKVVVNGSEVAFDTEPTTMNDRTMVPMRAIFEALGATVEWDESAQTITAANGTDTIILTVDDTAYYKNDKLKTSDVPPVLSGDRTLVPVRIISEALDMGVAWDEATQTVTISSDSDEWKQNTGEIDLDTMTVSGEGVQVNGSEILITKGGDFTVTGTLSDGMIHVNSSERVKLRLAGVTLVNSSGPAIFFEAAKKAYITLTEGTENNLTDGTEYTVEANAALYANDDLEIKGAGSLNVTANYKHGIVTKDDLAMEEGIISIHAQSGDGIHVNNTIELTGGVLKIESGFDGIQSEEDLILAGGDISITTTGEIPVSSNQQRGGPGGMMHGAMDGEMQPHQNNWSGAGQQGGQTGEEGQTGTRPEWGTPPDMQREGTGALDGQRPTGPDGQMMGQRPSRGENQISGMPEQPGVVPSTVPSEGADDTTATESSISSKGIKAETALTISGGTLNIQSTDHAVHCAAGITLDGGILKIESSSGKGISGHGDVTINGGEITITNSTEGIESKANLTINGGSIQLTATDDGLNTGGTDSAMGFPGQRPGGEETSASTGHDLTINGGTLLIDARGDGIDSNGNLYINGGEIYINGPTSGGNGSLDHDGICTVSGGTLVAVGSAGMLEAPGSTSTQNTAVIVLEETRQGGEELRITDVSGAELITFTPSKQYQSVIVSSPEFKTGETYTVYSGSTQLVQFTPAETVTNVGNVRGNMGGGGFGGRLGRDQQQQSQTQTPTSEV